MQKLFSTLLVTVLSLSGCGSSPVETIANQVVVAPVISASLPQNLQLTGTIVPAQETTASAKIPGRLATLLVDSGDRVSPGQTLARLESGTESAIVSSVNKNLQSAENNLQTITALYKESISNANKNLESLRQSTSKGADLSTTQLETAKNDLKQNTLSALTNSAITIQNSIDILDQILGISGKNKNLNDSYENYLGALKSSTKNEAEIALQNLIDTSDIFYPKFQTEIIGITNPTIETLDTNLSNTYDLLTKTKIALEKTYTMLINSLTNNNFPDSQLNSLKENVSKMGENIETLILTTQKIRGDKGVSSQIAILESQLGKTEADISTQITQAKLNIANLQKERDAKLAQAQSFITQLQGELGIQGTTLANTIVTAPIGGIIIDKLAESGQVISPGLAIFKIANDDEMKIILSIPDSAVASLGIGREAIIQIDGLQKEFQGNISKIAPAANSASKKIDIEIKIANPDKKLKSGMFARVEFMLSTSEGVIIPQSALISRYGQNFVFIFDDGIAKKRIVEPGNQSGESIAIIKGLSEGEIVIEKGQLYLSDQDRVEILEETE